MVSRKGEPVVSRKTVAHHVTPDSPSWDAGTTPMSSPTAPDRDVQRHRRRTSPPGARPANDLFRGMDMDMMGIGRCLPHPATPLGAESAARAANDDWPSDQVPNSELMSCKVLALTRLARPDANLPATTALSLVHKESGARTGSAPAPTW